MNNGSQVQVYTPTDWFIHYEDIKSLHYEDINSLMAGVYNFLYNPCMLSLVREMKQIHAYPSLPGDLE